MANLKDYFPDIPSVSYFKDAFSYGDMAYVCFDFDEKPSLDDIYLVMITDVLPNNDIFNDGIAVLGEIITYDENKIPEKEEVTGVLIYPFQNGALLTGEGPKYLATTIEDGIIKKVLLNKEQAEKSYILKMILEIPGTILNLHINIADNLLFKTANDIKKYIEKAKFNMPILYNKTLFINVDKNTLIFDDYKIYEDKVLSSDLNSDSLFEYMCYNCKTTPETKNSMNFSKKFPLDIKQIIPVPYFKNI